METIFEQRFAFDVLTIDAEKTLEEFKKDLVSKVYLEIEPILNAVLTHSSLSTDDQYLLINHIKKNVNIYYYMGDKNTFLKLIYLLSSPKTTKNLKDLKINIVDNVYTKDFRISSETLKKLPSNNLKQIYEIRYKDLLIRYIDHLILIFK